MQFCYGPMSKNIVDTILTYAERNPEKEIIFIPSRRQIEFSGGYVNNWTTKEFVEYVKIRNTTVKIERDHGGPGQGTLEDDGFESLTEDAKYMDIIHIDPWKKYSNIDEGIECSLAMINHCYALNKSVAYEIATEEAIRPFDLDELEYIIDKLKFKLPPGAFSQIKYLVIQCGTKLSESKNTGAFNEDRLRCMLNLAKKHNMIAKEHNGDWVDQSTIEHKKRTGLTHINIAPELGEVESRVILNKIRDNAEDYNRVYELCIISGKWKKWVTSDFDYINKKDEIILICGHYIFSYPEFVDIKSKYPHIDDEIKTAVYNRLLGLSGGICLL